MHDGADVLVEKGDRVVRIEGLRIVEKFDHGIALRDSSEYFTVVKHAKEDFLSLGGTVELDRGGQIRERKSDKSESLAFNVGAIKRRNALFDQAKVGIALKEFGTRKSERMKTGSSANVRVGTGKFEISGDLCLKSA